MENVGVSLEEGGIVRMVPILDCLYIRTSDGVNYESSVFPQNTLFNEMAFQY